MKTRIVRKIYIFIKLENNKTMKFESTQRPFSGTIKQVFDEVFISDAPNIIDNIYDFVSEYYKYGIKYGSYNFDENYIRIPTKYISKLTVKEDYLFNNK